uniref:Uncharacterized protein MANES_01G217700 n=1 Tax=Rhizophora mucronata TaxID=61149 RepID=A0A2P2K7S5_RHIMU
MLIPVKPTPARARDWDSKAPSKPTSKTTTFSKSSPSIFKYISVVRVNFQA